MREVNYCRFSAQEHRAQGAIGGSAYNTLVPSWKAMNCDQWLGNGRAGGTDKMSTDKLRGPYTTYPAQKGSAITKIEPCRKLPCCQESDGLGADDGVCPDT